MGIAGVPFPSDTEWWRVGMAALVTSLRERETLIRRLQAEQGQIVAEMESRGVSSTFGYRDVATVVADALNLGGKDAHRRLDRARACHDIAGITTTAPALAPHTAQAFAEGAISAEHVDVLVSILTEIPGTVPPDERAGYEKTLVELAREASPVAVRRAGRHLLLRLNQDGKRPDERDPVEPERELLWHWTRDGQLRFTGRLDTEAGQALEAALSPLAKPRPATDGTRDTRTVGQRQGDALAEMLGLVLDEGKLPVEAGERPHIIVTMSLDQLLRLNSTPTAADAADAASASPPTLNWEAPITAEQARRMACDAKIIPAVLGSDGELLDLGRTQRTVTAAQRRALALRDRGCVFSGCTRPVRWTQAHHVAEWTADHGPTDLANLCLLCSFHHRLVHHSDWQIRIAADGHAECIPPAWLDPKRKPRRNHAHHPITPSHPAA